MRDYAMAMVHQFAVAKGGVTATDVVKEKMFAVEQKLEYDVHEIFNAVKSPHQDKSKNFRRNFRGRENRYGRDNRSSYNNRDNRNWSKNRDNYRDNDDSKQRKKE